jgi:hypothetical protein
MNMRELAFLISAVAVAFHATINGPPGLLRAAEERAIGDESANVDSEHGDVVRAGAGGYLLTRPNPCKPLPEIVHKSQDCNQPVITGQWWSSLLWQQRKFSQPLFAHPLVATCTESGLAVSYPGVHIHGNEAGIFGSGSGPDGDLKLGHSAAPTFAQADCDGYSDWFLSVLFSNGPRSLRVSLGHGSPLV